MDHQTLGRWDDRPSDPAYYIEDCRIFRLYAFESCFIPIRQYTLPTFDLLNTEVFTIISKLYLLEIQIQLQKELDPNVGGGSGLLHMVWLVRNYTYTTKKWGQSSAKEKQQRWEKRPLFIQFSPDSSIGRIMKQQAFLGKKLFELRIVSRRLVAGCPIDIGRNSICPNA